MPGMNAACAASNPVRSLKKGSQSRAYIVLGVGMANVDRSRLVIEARTASLEAGPDIAITIYCRSTYR